MIFFQAAMYGREFMRSFFPCVGVSFAIHLTPFLLQFLTALTLFSSVEHVYDCWMRFVSEIDTHLFHHLSDWSKPWLNEWRKEMAMSSCDDCPFVEHPYIHGKAMLIGHTGAVSWPDNKQLTMDGGAITGLKTIESRLSCKKLKKIPDSLSSWGRTFQSLGAELKKALKPNCFLEWFSSTLGIQKRDWEDNRRDHGDSWWGISSSRYCGAVPLKQLHASERILWSMQSFTGSQWRFFKTGLIYPLSFVSVKLLAAVFCTSWRWCSFPPSSPHQQLLQQSSLDKTSARAIEMAAFLVSNGHLF